MRFQTTNRAGFLRRLLCLMLLLAMLLSMVACGDTSEKESQPTTGTTGTTGITQSTSSSGAETIQPNYDCDLEYELLQEDVDTFYALLDTCEALCLVGEDLEGIEASIEELDVAYEYLNAQCSIAMILHYNRTKDEALEEQYLDCVDICTEAQDAYLQMVRRLYLSDTPAKDVIFEGWTEEDFEDLLDYDEQIAAIQQRNAEIGVEYRTTNDDALKIQLYIELVQNNNAIAQYYGYENYYTYAYEKVYDRDYGMDELQQMREYAKLYLGTATESTYMNFSASYGELPQSGQSAVVDMLYSDFHTLNKNYIDLYIQSAPENLANAMTSMLEVDSFFAKSHDSEEGAFTTTIGDRSYCYFGPGYASSATVVHEGGHYYASLYADLNSIPLDLAEVHSQGNEWLFLQFLSGHFPEKRHAALVDYKLYENIAMILVCLMVDEFEQVVYSTDLTGFTAEDFDAIMDEIALQYFPEGNVGEVVADMNSYWRLVVVDQPIYYVSYAVSGIAAISLYTVATEDYDEAMTIYQRLCEAPTMEDGFLVNISAAGLYTPFDEEFYIAIDEIISSRR